MQPVDYKAAYENELPAVTDFVNIASIANMSEEAKLSKGQIIELQQLIIDFMVSVTDILKENA